MASRAIVDLHPNLRPLALKFLDECHANGYEVLITCTYRSAEEQNRLYAQGRTTSGNIVTKLKGGQSKHNATLDGVPASKAFDFVPIENGKLAWSNVQMFKRLGEIGKALGLVWGGDWKSFKDYPHFELNEK